MRSGVFDVQPSLLWEFRPEFTEERPVGGRVPESLVIAVASLDKAGVEVADDKGVWVLALYSSC